MKKGTYLAIIASLSLMYGQAMVFAANNTTGSVGIVIKGDITPFPVQIPSPLAMKSVLLAGRMLPLDTRARQEIRNIRWARTMRTVQRQLAPGPRQLTTGQRPLAIIQLLPGKILLDWELLPRRLVNVL